MKTPVFFSKNRKKCAFPLFTTVFGPYDRPAPEGERGRSLGQIHFQDAGFLIVIQRLEELNRRHLSQSAGHAG